MEPVLVINAGVAAGLGIVSGDEVAVQPDSTIAVAKTERDCLGSQYQCRSRWQRKRRDTWSHVIRGLQRSHSATIGPIASLVVAVEARSMSLPLLHPSQPVF
jgi:hypothetical protein